MSVQDVKELLDNNKNLSSGKGAKDGRSRWWAIIVYPESAPSNWREILNGEMWIESPLHDKDVYTKEDEKKNPEHKAGTFKKPHWHIILFYDGKKSYEQIKRIADCLNGARPEHVENPTGMIRYFAHMDSPEKAQYNPKEIIGHGIDVEKYLYTLEEIQVEILCQIIDFCEENNVEEFGKFIIYCRRNKTEWLRYLNKKGWLVREYLKSKHFERKEKKLASLMTAADVATLGEEALGDNDNDTIKEE